MGIARFERFFRAAAGLDVDKEDLKRYADFINRKSAIFSFAARPSLRPMGATSSSLSISRSPKGCRKASTGSRRSTRPSS
jgi:hypothetical protein